MAELKIQRNAAPALDFLNSVENEKRRADGLAVLKIMEEVTREKAEMWGDNIVGFGSYHYKYASGKEGDWMLTGFSPRKTSLTIYIMAGFGRYEELLLKLGKFKCSRSCLYINKLEDVDTDILKELIGTSVERMRAG